MREPWIHTFSNQSHFLERDFKKKSGTHSENQIPLESYIRIKKKKWEIPPYLTEQLRSIQTHMKLQQSRKVLLPWLQVENHKFEGLLFFFFVSLWWIYGWQLITIFLASGQGDLCKMLTFASVSSCPSVVCSDKIKSWKGRVYSRSEKSES